MRNDVVFQQAQWQNFLVEELIWNRLVDYGRAAWTRAIAKITKTPEATKSVLARFDKQ
jgi:hypothetical protein